MNEINKHGWRTQSLDRLDEAQLEKLVAYGKKFWHQTLYYKAGIEYDVESVTNMTRFLVSADENGGPGVVLYAEDADGAVVGLLLAIIGPFPMNNNYRAATEWVFYVDPEYRRSGLGQHLIAQAERVLKFRGVRFFSMISLANVEPEAAEGLYRHLGFEHTETSFTKDLG